MKFCIRCFREEHAGAVQAIVGDATSRGVCDFCQETNVDLWDVRQLAEAFTPLIQSYMRDDAADLPLAEQLQSDWQVFAIDDPQVLHTFLNGVYDGKYEFVAENPHARLQREDGVEAMDHVATWESLSKELIEVNRFFPKALAPETHNRQFFEEIIGSRKLQHDPGFEFFRARVCDSEAGLSADEMSMPDRDYARAGRANPLGIPHLYLAESQQTCLLESRAVQHNFVTVAKFVTTESVDLLDLKNRTPLNPFRDTGGNAAARLDVHRTIERLGRELKAPVRPTDSEVEYVPTQYLSGLVKNLGRDGILYGSSMDPDGTNAVLFDDSKVQVQPEVWVYEIEGMVLRSKPLSGPK